MGFEVKSLRDLKVMRSLRRFAPQDDMVLLTKKSAMDHGGFSQKLFGMPNYIMFFLIFSLALSISLIRLSADFTCF